MAAEATDTTPDDKFKIEKVTFKSQQGSGCYTNLVGRGPRCLRGRFQRLLPATHRHRKENYWHLYNDTFKCVRVKFCDVGTNYNFG